MLINEKAKELATKYLKKGYETLTKNEQRVIQRIAEHVNISRNTNREFDQELTFGQRLADRVASFGGSWTFIIIFAAILFIWIVLNSYILAKQGKSFDPYPYILLNLFLSMLAALQAPIIMMSQNRQSAKDRLDANHDYEVNLKAELEILSLHDKLDNLREEQWMKLIELQNEQIELLQNLLKENQTRKTEN